MYTITNFDKLLEVGREGEKAVSRLLERSGCEVEDVSKEKWHQVNDIDFIVRQHYDGGKDRQTHTRNYEYLRRARK